MPDKQPSRSSVPEISRRTTIKSVAALLAGSALGAGTATADHYDSKLHYEPQVDKENLMQLSVQGHTELEDGVLLDLGSHEGHIQLLGEGLARVSIVDPGEEVRESRAIANGLEEWDAPGFRVTEDPDTISIDTDTITVEITKDLFGVAFLDADGTVINEDYTDMGTSGYSPSPEKMIPDDQQELDPEEEEDRNTDPSYGEQTPDSDDGSDSPDPSPNEPLPYVFKKAGEDEAFYGFGEQPELTVDQRGKKLENWNTDQYGYWFTSDYVYTSVPFFIGVKDVGAYGIFFDNTHHTVFHTPDVPSPDPPTDDPSADDLNELYDTDAGEDHYYFVGDGGQLTYYFSYGPEVQDVLGRYTDLTGRMDLPPKWAIGFHQSKWEYSPEELLEVPRRYREEEIPLDALHFDIGYMNEFRVFTIRDDHRDVLAELRETMPELRTVAVNDPGVAADVSIDVDGDGQEDVYEPFVTGTGQDVWTNDENGETYVGAVWPRQAPDEPTGAVWPDFSRPDVRTWWAELHDLYFDEGFDGMKNDMGEPAVFEEQVRYDWTMPVRNQHGPDDDGNEMLHEEYHNVYGFDYARATREAFDVFKPDVRPFLLNRNLFAGGQRVAAIWTGDIVSQWPHLRMQIPMMMNLGMSGMPFNGHDVGGFVGRPTPELFKRWITLGAFIPYFRNHTDTHRNKRPDDPRNQHPWTFGEEAVDITRKYTELRYRMMPYLYNEFEDSAGTGKPVFQPLVYQYQDDTEVRDITDEFMFGDNVLMAPVVERGATERDVYLPEGDRWVDFWTNEVHEGGQRMTVDAPIDHLPIYVRKDEIVPMREVQQYTGQTPLTVLELRTYLDDEASYSFYEDDGETLAYEDGEFNITNFHVSVPEEGVVTFEREYGAENYGPYDAQDYEESELSAYLLNLDRSEAPDRVRTDAAEYAEVNAGGIRDSAETFAYDDENDAVLVHIPADEDGTVRLFFDDDEE
jgi:alpha-glucosidase